jgi:hypothetical protein
MAEMMKPMEIRRQRRPPPKIRNELEDINAKAVAYLKMKDKKKQQEIETKALKFLGIDSIPFDETITPIYTDIKVVEDIPDAPRILTNNTADTVEMLQERFRKLKIDQPISVKTEFENSVIVEQNVAAFEAISEVQAGMLSIKGFLEKESEKISTNNQMQQLQFAMTQEITKAVQSLAEENKLIRQQIELSRRENMLLRDEISTSTRTTSMEVTSNQTRLMQLARTGVRGVLKQAIVAPVKMLNIVVFQPANYAFWHIFGKFAYLLWGILMLLIVVIFAFSILISINKNFPNAYMHFYNICSLIFKYLEFIYTPLTSAYEKYTSEAIIIVKDSASETMDIIKANAVPKIYEGSTYVVKQGAYYVKINLLSLLGQLAENTPYPVSLIVTGAQKMLNDGSLKKLKSQVKRRVRSTRKSIRRRSKKTKKSIRRSIRKSRKRTRSRTKKARKNRRRI